MTKQIFEALPSEMQVRGGLEGALVAALVAEGLKATRQTMARGEPVRDIFELESLKPLFDAATPADALEGYALRAGHNAAIGWAVRENNKRSASLTPPGMKSWIARARRGLGFKAQVN